MTDDLNFEFCNACAKLSGKDYEQFSSVPLFPKECIICGTVTWNWHTKYAKEEFLAWLDSLGDE